MPRSDLFPIPRDEGKNKVCSLRDAIRRNIRPGMSIHLCSTHTRSNALVYELVRQFHGKRPGFTIVTAGLIANGVILLHEGLVRKVVASFCGDSYPSPGPNPVVQRAYLSGEVAFENWSILTLPLRLMAGAMGVPFMPTKSIVGSTMEKENCDSFFVLKKGKIATGMVRALNPDITLVHGVMADANGNTVITPPYGIDIYGAMASREGAIVSVEKIVSTEEIRRYAHLVKIPGHMVRAVCPVTLGAHPSGLNGQGIHGFNSYCDDYDFVEDVRAASIEPERMDSWIKKWVLGPRNHEDYLGLLGPQRILFLKGKADPDSWKAELLEESPEGTAPLEASPGERMAVMGARRLCERIVQNGYKTLLAGIGVSNLSAWLAYYDLIARGIDIELMAEIGFYGYAPRPSDPFIFNFRNIPTCKMLSGTETIMGILMGGELNKCIGAIGAGQIDQYGNINSTLVPKKQYLTGSGGANDICSSAQEVLVTAIQTRGKFLKKVPYITSTGKRVRTIVSDLGVFEKISGSDTFILKGYFPFAQEEEALREIKERCGWPLKVVRRPERLKLPTQDELHMLKLFDPKGQFFQ